MADPNQKYDAVDCPRDYPQAPNDVQRALLRNQEFGPMLGCKRVVFRLVGADRALGTRGPNETMFHAREHHRSGQDRYDWFERGDGVRYGVLLPDDDPTEKAKADAAAKIKARHAEVTARVAELQAVPAESRTPEQSAELVKLQAWVGRLFTHAAEANAHANA